VPPQLPAPQPIQAAPLQPPQNVQPPVPKIVVEPPPPKVVITLPQRTLAIRMFLLLKALHEAAHLKYRNSWDEQDEMILLNILLSNLEKFLQGLTSPLRK